MDDPYALPKWGLKFLRKYFKEKNIRGRLKVSSYNGKPVDSGKDGKGVYCLIFIIRPFARCYEVFENGSVTDLGCEMDER